MRFRPEQHLRRERDIRAVRESGRRIDGRAFTIWWLARGAVPPPSRMCVIASTAAVGHAVLRNRAKRRLREVYRRHQTLVPPGVDLLLIARSSATRWPLPEIEQKFVEACGHIARAVPSNPS